jgi:V8-like Glu-specific endopeptidase
MVVSKKMVSKNMMLCIGTGCLIGPNVVLTCAHNVYQVDIRKDHQEIEFIPAPISREIKSKEYSKKGFSVKEIIVPDQYKNMDRSLRDEYNQGHLFDMAVLILDPQLNLEEYFGSLSYNFDWEESPFIKNIEIMKGLELIGFPRVAYIHQFYQFLCSAVSAKNFMLYSLSTLPGSSGSPLSVPQENEPYAVIAIHVLDVSHIVLTNNERTERKAALKLRSDMFQHLQQTEQRVKCTYDLRNSYVIQVQKKFKLRMSWKW